MNDTVRAKPGPLDSVEPPPSLFTATITTIPYVNQRYETVGDWTVRASPPSSVALDVAVSVPSDWRHAALVGVHELIEAIICRHRGVTQQAVDDWDYSHRDLGEPGGEPGCPYRREHQFATVIEKLLAAELGVAWRDYCAALASIE